MRSELDRGVARREQLSPRTCARGVADGSIAISRFERARVEIGQCKRMLRKVLHAFASAVKTPKEAPNGLPARLWSQRRGFAWGRLDLLSARHGVMWGRAWGRRGVVWGRVGSRAQGGVDSRLHAPSLLVMRDSMITYASYKRNGCVRARSGARARTTSIQLAN